MPASLPAGKTGFATIELKTNFMGTARVGELLLVNATAVHRGRTTQVWDAIVTTSQSREGPSLTAIPAFRCTQLFLDPR